MRHSAAGDTASPSRPVLPAVALLCVTLVSAALISYEIVLMRRLLIERWHHFGYLVISAALLGFGVSGTLLALIQSRVRARPRQTLWWSAAGLAAALIILPRAAAALPVTARFIPADLWRQIGWWSLYWTAAAVPFLLGAVHIGGALLAAGQRVGRVYAVNLFGSAVGAVGGALLVARLPIEYGLWPALALSLAATAVLGLCRSRLRSACSVVLIVAAVAVEWLWPALPRYDEYKYAATIERLVAQGSARRVARAADPHGYIEIYESDLFHGLPFLALSKPPPPMYSVLINGDPAGSIFRINDSSQADVMDQTLMAFPYALIRPRPRVLLIGETGGTNVWLARRQHAEHIVVVQPNAALVDLLRGPLSAAAGDVLNRRDVSVFSQSPRAFLTRKMVAYDLIQIVSLEGLGIASAGMHGLAEDHLVTVEGFAAALRKLDPGGVLSVCRGIQTPQRENIRLLATLAEALESIGVDDPGRHIVQVRDYLGVCTMALRSPLDAERRPALRAAIRTFNLTPVWYDGLPLDEVNRPDVFTEGPPNSTVDWLHYAAGEIFSPRREAFYLSWLTNVRPPRDDRPFFWDFYRRAALPVLRQAYGDLWLTRAELGRLFLYASLIVAAATALVLILIPLAVAQLAARRQHGGGGAEARAGAATLGAVLYFAAIGLGFMCVEMALISRAIRVLGDPVIASAVVIGGVLALSGLGSLAGAAPAVQRRLGRRGVWLPPALVAGLAVLTMLLAWEPSAGWSAAFGTPALLVLLATLLAGCMGVPLPAGIAALDRRTPALVPWAWGVNGVASVIGTSLALVVAMDWGYRDVVALAAGLYAVAALASLLLERRPAVRGAQEGPRPG